MPIDSTNPEHYGVGKEHQCIDVMLQQFGHEEVMSFCKLNAFKYLFRMGRKDAPLQEAKKAAWYLATYERLKQEKENTNNKTQKQ